MMKSAGKTTLVMAAGAGVTAMMLEVTRTCPDLTAQLPAILGAGAVAAWALWMPSPKAPPVPPPPLEVNVTVQQEEPAPPLPPIDGK